MNKQEILNYLAEKKRITAPVAVAESNVNKAEQNYEKTTKNGKQESLYWEFVLHFGLLRCSLGMIQIYFILTIMAHHKLEDLVVHSSLAHSSLLYST